MQTKSLLLFDDWRSASQCHAFEYGSNSSFGECKGNRAHGRHLASSGATTASAEGLAGSQTLAHIPHGPCNAASCPALKSGNKPECAAPMQLDTIPANGG